ncbi:MAG: hypothetical protein IKS22_08335 [Bacteroidales bacterium]|nr:hypothetical protein [Bacteroidales bacterium]
MKYSAQYPITASNIDREYRLSVDGLLTFHENTVARYMTLLGLAAFDLQKTDRTWVISEINLLLPEPPSIWSEDIRITLWISEMSSLRAWFDFIAEEVHTGKEVAKGNSCWSLISMSERKLLPCSGLIPEDRVIPEFAAGPHRKRPLPFEEDGRREGILHKVNRLDLDFNGHMNNRRYIPMVVLSLGEEYLSGRRPDSLNIRFLREARLGDSLSTYIFPTSEEDTFVGKILSDEGGEEVCRITLHWREREETEDIASTNYVRNP